MGNDDTYWAFAGTLTGTTERFPFRWDTELFWNAVCLRIFGDGHWIRVDRGPFRRAVKMLRGYSYLWPLEHAGLAESRVRRRWWGGKVYEWRLTDKGFKADWCSRRASDGTQLDAGAVVCCK